MPDAPLDLDTLDRLRARLRNGNHSYLAADEAEALLRLLDAPRVIGYAGPGSSPEFFSYEGTEFATPKGYLRPATAIILLDDGAQEATK